MCVFSPCLMFRIALRIDLSCVSVSIWFASWSNCAASSRESCTRSQTNARSTAMWTPPEGEPLGYAFRTSLEEDNPFRNKFRGGTRAEGATEECRHWECRHWECRRWECRHWECRHWECRHLALGVSALGVSTLGDVGTGNDGTEARLNWLIHDVMIPA